MTAAPLLLRDVRPMGRPPADVLIRNGIIESRGEGLKRTHPECGVVECAGRLLLPGFVDGHMHLDKTLLGLPWRPHEAGPTLQDRIQSEKRVRRELGVSVSEQAERLARLASANGTTHIRTHVDVDPEIGLRNLEDVVAARERLADQVEIQVVAFPQSGLISQPGTLELMETALQGGADVLGGLDPAGIDRDPAGQLDRLFELAARHSVPIDIHLHDPGELGAFQLELIVERTRALSFQGRVAVSHAFCLGQVDGQRRGRLIEQLADARVAIMTHGPGERPFPPILELRRAGVVVFSGSDGVRDAWTPHGSADMLERAWLLAYRSGFRRDDQLEASFSVTTDGGAAALGLDGYGIEPGCCADLVTVQAETLAEAVVARPPRDHVIKSGKLVGSS